MNPGGVPAIVFDLTGHLRRRGIPLGVDDVEALRRALAAGFGWESSDHLARLCVSLWAKTRSEGDLIRAAIAALDLPVWTVPAAHVSRSPAAVVDADVPPGAVPMAMSAPAQDAPPAHLDLQRVADARPATADPGLPLMPPASGRRDPSLVLSPQYPVTERDITQTWRRLRRIARFGPPVEFDMAATLRRRAEAGVPVPAVLVPRRRNTARLVLLIDRSGSMAPYHGYVDHIVKAIRNAGRLDSFTEAYFRNTAGPSGQNDLLDRLPDPFANTADAILSMIRPLAGGRLSSDRDLTDHLDLNTLLDGVTPHTAVAVISDAGAVRGHLRPARVVDTVALLRAVSRRTDLIAWLNPLSRGRWAQSTAEQIARHIPMFSLTREGMHAAVDVLRGRPHPLERPL